jgi:hypothetical protein
MIQLWINLKSIDPKNAQIIPYKLDYVPKEDLHLFPTITNSNRVQMTPSKHNYVQTMIQHFFSTFPNLKWAQMAP